MVTETFGDVLFCSGSESYTEFPSPESLKKRIIISTKLPKEYLESESIKKENNSPEEKEVSDIRYKLEAFDEVH